LEPKDFICLMDRRWEGNVSELKSMIYKLVIDLNDVDFTRRNFYRLISILNEPNAISRNFIKAISGEVTKEEARGDNLSGSGNKISDEIINSMPEEKSKKILNIKMTPRPGKTSNNEIVINTISYKKVQNSPFDFLYYLLFLRKNYPDQKASIKLDEGITVSIKDAITGNDSIIKERIEYSWNDEGNKRIRNEKSKQVNYINDLFKKEFLFNQDVVIESGNYYVLSSEFKPENIELVPYTNIF